MVKHRSHSAIFKHLVAQEYLSGESLTELSNRHGVSRDLIRVWVAKLEAGALDDDVRTAELVEEYEARIAALERLVGRQAVEIEFLKGALKRAPRRPSAPGSAITGPPGSASPEAVG
jgi:transposase